MKYKKRVLTIILALIIILSISVVTGYGQSDTSAEKSDYITQITELNTQIDLMDTYIADHREILNSIKNEGYVTADDFKIQEYVINDVTIESGSYNSSSFALENNSTHQTLEQQGYVSKGVTSFAIDNADTDGKNATYCVMNRYYLNNDNINALVRNTATSSQAVVKIRCYVLYVKSN